MNEDSNSSRNVKWVFCFHFLWIGTEPWLFHRFRKDEGFFTVPYFIVLAGLSWRRKGERFSWKPMKPTVNSYTFSRGRMLVSQFTNVWAGCGLAWTEAATNLYISIGEAVYRPESIKHELYWLAACTGASEMTESEVLSNSCWVTSCCWKAQSL